MTLSKSITVCAAAILGCVAIQGAHAQVQQGGRVTSMVLPEQQSVLSSGIDFAHAKPLPLPTTRSAAMSASDMAKSAVNPAQVFGAPGGVAGGLGSGKESPVQLVPAQKLSDSGVAPDEFGTSAQPYTTSRANANGDYTAKYYPFRAAGKLFFKIGSSSYLCSASLIKPGVVVTAAHCVANYGARQFYSGWTFVPAYNNGTAPYGTWTAKTATILTSYYAGTDNCAQYGVICPDDVAVITENPQSGRYPGSTTGWFGYGWNGYSYNGSSQALITQLGYPVALDGGLLMQRNDSQGFTNRSYSNNTIIGSLMTGGSSGGPWVVNLGTAPSLSGVSFGTYANHNVVVGVTSWGFTNSAVKQQGAAPFTSNNIVTLVTTACKATPGAC